MNIIFNKIISQNNIEYTYFDTDKHSIGRIHLKVLYNNTREFYGVQILNGSMKFNGYNNIPVIKDGKITHNIHLYTVVGKFIERKNKKYLLIRGDGTYLKVNEQELIRLNANGVITNLIKSNAIVRLKSGSIITLNKARNNTNKEDTLIKIHDYDDMEAGSPGVAKKFIGMDKGTRLCGMAKYTVTPSRNDNKNEVLAYELGKLFGVKVCRAKFGVYKTDDNWVLSVFEYDIRKLMSCKKAFGTDNFHNNFNVANIEKYFGEKAVDNFNRMVIFDTITFQEDRHISNFAFMNRDMYPLYDNGRCLFWDKTDQLLDSMNKNDVISLMILNEHGYGFSYLDGVLGSANCRKLIKNNVTEAKIYSIIKKYYNTKRARILSNLVYKAYKIVMGY